MANTPDSHTTVLPAPDDSICCACMADDDGPHGHANVPAEVEIDFVQLCAKCALAHGATYREIAAALSVLSCDRCCSTLDIQDPQVRFCVRCSVESLSDEFPVAVAKGEVAA